MITRTIIFGERAVKEFENTGIIPSSEWMEEYGGLVDRKSFKSTAEHNAYMEALEDYDGHHDFICVDNGPAEKKCGYCQTWQSFFADRESDTYCPDCGSLIISAKPNNEKSAPTKIQFRSTDNREWRDFPSMPTVENFNIDFPAEFLHNYYSSNYVAWEDDMRRFIDGELTLEEFRKHRHEIETKEEAKEEMYRLREKILEEAFEDFFADLIAGKFEFRRVATT